MKIEVKALKLALRTIAHLVPKNPTLRILENVALEPQGNHVVIRATDLTTEAQVTVAATLPFAVCVPARQLLDFVASTKSQIVEFRRNGTKLIVATSSDTLELTQPPSRDFPKTMLHVAGSVAHLDGNQFIDALSWAFRAVGHDETRDHLTGVLLENDKIVATDGHRLHEATVDGLRCTKALIPGSAAAFLIRSLGNGAVTLDVANDTVRFQTETWTITTKQLDVTTFPPYAQVIPTKFYFEMNVAGPTLVAGLKRISKFRGKASRPVKLRANGAIKLQAIGEDTTLTTTVAVSQSTHLGDDHVVGFDGRYLAEALNGMDAVALRFERDPLSPLVIAGDGKLAVVMPMRL